ncbi:MAG: hypothetical protein Q4E50_01590 [Tissierellia bacterium]|nr:hypothetical protein [Tissierellia bacterium]
MISLKLDSYLEKKLQVFAKDNKIEIEELIETILYEYIDDLEEKKGPLLVSEPLEEDNYNPEDVAFVENALGFRNK